ncbi:hypothetical protein B0T11DRAFT_337589 [Plectosphaerella cucumerina]|uniref:Uncharacterized protein n=1 Tax=Plectosphaerella cucumerina TaxID=40658 RepID=A0A8K0TL89_9PEZI|nr:hypothetical protein B0T11DRAFT_337589 [Plectosphaerella cucumerina]
MKSSPVVLLSLGLLASATPPGGVLDARAIAPENPSFSSTLESRSDASNVEVGRKAKAKRLRRHKQALERLRQRRAADDTDTDTDHDTDDDEDHRHVTTTSRSTLQTTLKAPSPGPTTWNRDCDTTDTEALGVGSSVTIAATPGPGNDVPALADHELTAAGPGARPEAVGGAVVLAGLVAAAMVL